LSIERTILASLIFNEPFSRRVIPYLKSEYFEEITEREIFNVINHFIIKYNNLPSKVAVIVELEEKKGLFSDEQFIAAVEVIKSLDESKNDDKWLLENTEKFCKDRAIYNATAKAIAIYNGDDKANDRGILPKEFSDALSVSFDTHIGHDYFEDAAERYDELHRKEFKISFNLEYFNKITKGGFSKKTVNVIIGGIGVGKTLAMCDFAAYNLMCAKNVLYITLEMSDKQISNRIDANLLDLSLESLYDLPKEDFLKLIDKVKGRTIGKLEVKEYPTSQASVSNFRFLLQELKLKKKFIPDIIYVDYINLCLSARLKYNSNANSYTIIKSIAEELRGLAVEQDLPIVTASQLTRSGQGNSDPGIQDTAESIGLPATADFQVIIVQTEELEKLGQYMIIQIKNRYGDVTHNKRFVIGVDKTKMKLYDCEQSAQEDLTGGPEIHKEEKGNSNLFNGFN
jgi:replicative DNA helicase